MWHRSRAEPDLDVCTRATQDCLGAGIHGVSLWLHSPQAPGSQSQGSNGRGLQVHSPVLLFFSWRFTCTNLWKACVHRSLRLQMALAHSPVLVHRVDLFPLVQEMGVFYVDEVIIADTNLTGDHRIHSPPWTCPSIANFKLSTRGCSPVSEGETGEVHLACLGSKKRMGFVLCALGPYISLANSSFFSPTHCNACSCFWYLCSALILLLPCSEALVSSSIKWVYWSPCLIGLLQRFTIV